MLKDLGTMYFCNTGTLQLVSTFVSPEGHLKTTGSLRTKLDKSNHPYSITRDRIVSRFFIRLLNYSKSG